MSSKLFYFGTQDEVELGDRVQYTTLLLRRKQVGTIVCIPEMTALERIAENKDPEDWLVRFDDGTFAGWMYHPEEVQPRKRLSLLGRAAGPVEQVSNEELERLDSIELEKSGVVGDLLGWATIIVAATAIIVLLSQCSG